MKTLNEAALDYARAFCPYEDSNPRTQVAGAYEAFMAGAAAMAERIAAGASFSLTPQPRHYWVEFPDDSNSGHLIVAFDATEAMGFYEKRFGGLSYLLSVRPATSEEIKKAKS
jgi:hypothetical protein